MKKHLIYIATDPNRVSVEAGYTQDLLTQSSHLQFHSIHSAGRSPKLNRIVHAEEFSSFDMAQKRLIELRGFTRMQKERLIRKHNPNWLSINSLISNTANPATIHFSHALASAF